MVLLPLLKPTTRVLRLVFVLLFGYLLAATQPLPTARAADVATRTVRAAPRPLPAVMADFALNLDTGRQLASISATTGTVYLFDNIPENLFADATNNNNNTALEATASQSVGNLPTSILYKTYQQESYWIVACSHDAHLHIFKADTALTVVAHVAFAGVGATHLSASSNSKDPFVYYNYVPNDGAGYKSPKLGVIHLGDLQDRGPVPTDWDNTSISASISADGQMLYNTGEHVGFSSYTLANGNVNGANGDVFDGVNVPSFALSYCQVESQRPNARTYVPDVSGEWVSTNQVVLPYGLIDRTDDTQVSATLFTPDPSISVTTCATCCPYPNIYQDWSAIGGLMLSDVPISAFSSPLQQPVGLGLANVYNSGNNDLTTHLAALVLDTTSSEFGKTLAHNLTVPNEILGISPRDPYGKYEATASYNDYNNNGNYDMEEEEWEEPPYMGNMVLNNAEPHVLASSNGNNDMGLILVAHDDRIGATSVKCFLEDSFDLTLDTKQFVVGQADGAAQVQLDTSTYQLEWNGLPDGAIYDQASQRIQWTPTPEQVGLYKVQAVLTETTGTNSESCAYTVTLEATYPVFVLEHPAERLFVTHDGSTAVAWTANQVEVGNSRVTLIENIAAINQAEIVMSTTQLTYVASRIFVGPHMLVVFEQHCSTLHLLDRTTFAEIKSMPNPAVMNTYDCDRENVFDVDEESGLLRVYPHANGNNQQTTTLDISGTNDVVEVATSKPYYTSTTSSYGDAWVEGILKNGILYDHLDRDKPLLVLDPGPFFVGGRGPDMSKLYAHPDGYVTYEDDEAEGEYDEEGEYMGYSSSPFEFLHRVPNLNGYQMIEVPEAGILVQILNQEDRFTRTFNSTLTVLDLTGRQVEQFPFFRVVEERNSQGYYSYYNPILKGRNKALFVAYGRRLFRWMYDGEPPSVQDNKAFHFQDVQTTFDIPSDNPNVKLEHTLLGGTRPFDIFLQYPTTGDFDLATVNHIVSVDGTTGTLSIDGQALYKEAVNALVTFGVLNGLPEVRSASLKSIEPWSKLPSALQTAASSDLPVALPIFLRAVDQTGEKASLEYFVCTHVEYETLVPLINKALDELQNPHKNNNTHNSNNNADSSSDNRDLEIQLLIAMVVLLIIILMLLVCFLVYKFVIQSDKESAAAVEKEEVDGLIRTDGAPDATGASSNHSDDPSAVKEFRDQDNEAPQADAPSKLEKTNEGSEAEIV